VFTNKLELKEKVKSICTVRDELMEYFLDLPRREGSLISRKSYGAIYYSFTGGEDYSLRLYEGSKVSFDSIDEFFLYISELTSLICLGESSASGGRCESGGGILLVDPSPSLYFLENMTATDACARLLEIIRIYGEDFRYQIPEYYLTLISDGHVISIWTDCDKNDLGHGAFLVETVDGYLFYAAGY